ncbi:MAG: MBL fold metallo-hydrolase [Candidatus Curtissbacteria bacterium]|nr:MBL fold metallo-hydrolase [Candidatus Curtissbacteria bacterium]
MQIKFLGTGASGGTRGVKKSKRLESSVLIKNNLNILIDVTRDFLKQAKDIEGVDVILLTHGHMDACGGMRKIQKWLNKHKKSGITVFAHPKTLKVIQTKFKISGFKLIPVKDGQDIRLDSWKITPYEVPHSKDKKFPTFAWKLKGLKTIIYASDTAKLTKKFQNICQGADLLIVDGSTWERKIYSHLRVDKDLPKICQWKVSQIFLTQIGKSVPPHEKFQKELTKICPRAFPAYDGLKLYI